MIFKKTFWMNLILAMLFTCLAVIFLYQNGIGIFIDKGFYSSLIGFDTIFFFVFSPIVPIATAYVLKKDKQYMLAIILNLLLIVYVAAIALFAFCEPKSMSKFMLQAKVFMYVFTFIIPSTISLRALVKIKK